MSNIIVSRRHEKLVEKQDIHKLLSDTYIGGDTYKNGENLIRYSIREPAVQFTDRQERAIYINTVRPILDILVSFIFNEKQERDYGIQLEFLKDKISGQRGIETFMRNLATCSGLYTCGVLIDSPNQESLNDVLTKLDQNNSGLQPFAKIYTPFNIRDFNLDDRGNLTWVLLDDTLIDKSNPLDTGIERRIYTLWTKDEFIQYEITEEVVSIHQAGGAIVETTEEVANAINSGSHPIGEVPFRFVNWRDIDSDYISDTPFETAAQLSKQIYNVMSYLDEMLAGGTFKTLFYPAKNAKDIPTTFSELGVSGSTVVNFDPTSSHVPFFAGQGLQEVEPFLKSIDFYIKQIMSIFGMDEDRDKKFVQSGVAKSLEFSKSETLLRNASTELERAEKWIIETAAKWIGIKNSNVNISYQKQYQSEDIEQQVAREIQLTMTPFESVNREAWSSIVKKTLSDSDDKIMKEMLDEIAHQEEPKEEIIQSDAEKLAEEESKARQLEDEKNQDEKTTKQQSDAEKTDIDA